MKLNKKKAVLIIDGDLPCYSIGFGAADIKQSWIVDSRIEGFIKRLQERTGVQNYEIYLSGKGNFRDEIAVSYVYKEGRPPKPEWYRYIRQYFLHVLGAELVNGMEADDMLAIRRTQNPNAVGCTIDKDDLQVQGWHYSWKTHNRDEIPLHYVDSFGMLELREKVSAAGKITRKVYGEGVMWLYSQALLGDKTDSIVGLKGYGDVKVYNTLKDCKTESELYLATKEAYEGQFGEEAEVRLKENMDLLYMVRELNEKGEPILWQPPQINQKEV